MGSDTSSIIIILICIIMSAYFSATETAFSSLNRIRIKNMAEKGNKKAALVLRLSENYDSVLSTILIGNNVVNILLTSLATLLFVKLLAGSVGEEAAASICTVVTTIVVLIFGEVSPKSVAKEYPEKFAMFSAPFLNMLVIILTPFSFLFGLWKKLLSLIFKGGEDRSITEDELLTIVEEAEQGGGIDEQEGDLIRSAIEFKDLEAVDILTPRIDITGVDMDSTKEEIAKVLAESGYSRIPIYKEDIDHIQGIIYQKDFHNYVYNSNEDIEKCIRPALFITKHKKISELLSELQQKKLHIAVVLDEFGGTVGIVTLEDILEEIVGEIWDEHDEILEEIKLLENGDYEVSGSANIEKVFEELDMEGELDILTVSGWVMGELERIPDVGDQFVYQGKEVTVLEMNGKRVKKVKIVQVEAETKEEE